MKRNIDLTEDQLFTTRSNVFNMKIPWIFFDKKRSPLEYDSDLLDDNSNSDPLVFVGNKEDRVAFKFVKKFETGESCLYCGKNLSARLWKLSYGLCDKCNEVQDKTFRKSIEGYWGIEPNNIRSSDILNWG